MSSDVKIKQAIAAAAIVVGAGIGAIVGGMTASDITSDVTVSHGTFGSQLTPAP